MSDDLTELLAVAAEEALKEREQEIFGLRLGLNDGSPHTLEEVGVKMGVTRERIRQILVKCQRKLRSRARQQKRKGNESAACARLLSHLEDVTRPQEEGARERTLALLADAPHGLCLLVEYMLPELEPYVAEIKSYRERERRSRRAAMREERARTRFSKLLGATAWPAKPRRLPSSPFTSRVRTIRQERDGDRGAFYSDKLRRDVQFESELEHRFYLQLELAGEVASYQEQPCAIPYTLNERERQYVPDVFVLFTDGRGAFVDLTPTMALPLSGNLAKWGSLRQFCTRAGYGLLVTDGRIPIQALMKHHVPDGFRAELCAALEAGPLGWNDYEPIRERHEVRFIDFAALVLQERLIWRRFPFVLERRSNTM